MSSISTLFLPCSYKAPPRQNLLLFLLLFCFTHSLPAQVKAGQWHLGGQFSFQTGSTVNIEPNFGLMLSPGWSIGLSLPFELSAHTNGNFYRLGAAPFVRRYFDLKSNFYALVQLQTGAQFNLNTGSNRQTTFNIRLLPAITYFVNPRFALEAGFGEISYINRRYKNRNQEYNDRSSKVQFGSTPTFSLRYYFPTSSKSPKE